MNELLCQVADQLTGFDKLFNSRWGNCESETLATQAILSCRHNYREHEDAFSWQGIGTTQQGCGGLVDNCKGIRSLVNDKCIVIEPYNGDLTAPAGTIQNEAGQPMVIRVTDRLLQYAAKKCGIE